MEKFDRNRNLFQESCPVEFTLHKTVTFNNLDNFLSFTMDSSKIVKTVLLVTIAVLFLVTSIMSIISASRMISETAQTYILGVESCTYKPVARPLEAKENYVESEEECKIDYNNAKRVFAESIAMLIIALPISVFTYRRLFKIYRE